MPKSHTPVFTNRNRIFRDDFNNITALDTNNWAIIQNDMTVSINSNQLFISTGTTAGAKCKIRCVHPISLSTVFYAALSISNRRAEQVTRFAIVSDDGLDACGWEFADAAPGTSTAYTMNNGVKTTSSLPNSNNTNSLAKWEVTVLYDRVIFNNNPLTDNMHQRTDQLLQNCPSLEKTYYLEIYVENINAPAGNTNIAFDSIGFVDVNEMYTVVLGGRGTYMPQGAITTSGIVRNYMVHYSDSTTPLGANATFTGTSRLLGNPNFTDKFRAFANADQGGTLYIEQSRNGSTWHALNSVSVSANTPTTLEASIYMQYVRVRYVNGATPQTSFELNSCAVSI